MVVFRMDRSIPENVICKHSHLGSLGIPASHVATQGKKGAPGQILGGLLTILLMAAKKPRFSTTIAFYRCSFSEHRCRDHLFETWQLVADVAQSQLPW